LSARFAISFREQEIDASWTDPYFMDTNITVGADLFATTTDYTSESGYKQQSFGGTVRGGYDVIDYLHQTWRYTLRSDRVSDISAGAPLYIQEQQGSATTSLIGQDLTYDRRDNRLDPTTGYFWQWSSDYAGLGGTVKFIRNVVLGSYYYPIADQWTAAIRGEGGYIDALGEQVRITDKFFLGGDNFIGFRTSGVGPRDIDSKDAVGGLKYFVVTPELSYPIGLPKEFGIVGKAFTQIGTLVDKDTDLAGISSADSPLIRVSVGVGLGWKSPFGPIRVNVAYPVVRDPHDIKELFRFSFGTRF
ncbi:MAG TPA: BamA/TamA family outer membrane protein, partial [Alphaproteobacteria bacterium]|nr:BamA/TamA family outer membrane protein [Alphaproteobacteria bacterium]